MVASWAFFKGVPINDIIQDVLEGVKHLHVLLLEGCPPTGGWGEQCWQRQSPLPTGETGWPRTSSAADPYDLFLFGSLVFLVIYLYGYYASLLMSCLSPN